MRTTFALAAALLLGLPVAAQSVPGGPPRARGPAGVLYRYAPHEGQERLHAEGYRRHLAWHVAEHDPLDWWAWRVETGLRRGEFVDGTFGVPWSAFDARVKPSEDGADYAVNAGPFARLVDCTYVELFAEASVLRGGAPAPVLDVYAVEAAPGLAPRLEAFLRETRAALLDERAWYRVVQGGVSPSYLVVFPRAGSADLADGERFWRRLAELPGGDILATAVRAARSERWRFLPDLSLFPPR